MTELIRTCGHCGGPIEASARPHAKFCSAKCRAASSRASKAHALNPDTDDGNDDDQSAPPRRRSRRKANIVAGGVLAVGLALVGLSLIHLEKGVEMVTGASERDGWLMAVGIDLSFTILELAMLVSEPAICLAVSRFAVPAVVGTLGVSAAMNSMAFASRAQGWLLYPAIGLGCAIPALVYVLMRVAAIMLFGEEKHQ